MKLPPKLPHPMGCQEAAPESPVLPSAVVDTYGGKIHMEWDTDAAVTPMGLLPYFIQFLKVGGRFDPWVDECPLSFTSPNAPQKINVLGSLFLSILSGHRRYSHLNILFNDNVSPGLLGMTKIVSDDSARRAIKKIPEESGVKWLQNHLSDCCAPLLNTPWILDVDTTVKPLYGHQEDAVKGYNPHKPGRPSHTYHSYLVANLRLVLDVEVKAGDQSHSTHSLPGLIALLTALPDTQKPAFVRGDIDFGNDTLMRELESLQQPYLFKLKRSKNVKQLIYRQHGQGEWIAVRPGWEAKWAELTLQGWSAARKVAIVRRAVASQDLLGLESSVQKGGQLALLDESADIKAYEYSVLVTSIPGDDIRALFQHYRDRADGENSFDELKNQWGWGGYTSHDIKSCRLMARMIALIYNWWNLYVRLASPDHHQEAITSRPLLLSSIGRQTQHSNKTTIKVTSTHAKIGVLAKAFQRLKALFSGLKTSAPQLTLTNAWQLLMQHIIDQFVKPFDRSDPAANLLRT